jgi:uracil-DNA glycosylase
VLRRKFLEAIEIMQEITQQVSVCEKCNLHFSRKRSVPGEGPVNAQILFIGEGPGFNENEMGRPFVGQAGKFLDELIGYAGFKRAEVFITNVVKCRPPENRDPLPEELNACAAYLDRQIETINPLVIVTLGRYSMAKFFPLARISSIHGKPAWVGDRLVIPMFHPAAALHQPTLKNDIISDFVNLPKAIEESQKKRIPQVEIIKDPETSTMINGSAEQLSLF